MLYMCELRFKCIRNGSSSNEISHQHPVERGGGPCACSLSRLLHTNTHFSFFTPLAINSRCLTFFDERFGKHPLKGRDRSLALRAEIDPPVG